MAQKPSTPKGTRDFSPQEMLRRKYIFSTIEKVFRTYGFLPLETPAMENLSTLTGKYGEEGDRLIFKVLNSGDFMNEVKEKFDAKYGSETVELSNEVIQEMRLTIAQVRASEISEKALRYDLTVPFARYVVQHQNEITFPFKRYQIQPVWRADRPQKGRYREFYQCDADVIGSKSLLNEVDLLLIMREVFAALGLNVQILVNNRKVLSGMAKLFKVEERLVDFVTILDKFDKIGVAVLDEYRKAGFPEDAVARIEQFVMMKDSVQMTPRGTYLRMMFAEHDVQEGLTGLDEIDVLRNISRTLFPNGRGESFEVDLLLARGLNYYTGTIFEVKALEGTLQSSICGGGRYDDLTGIFGLKDMSGVGISFGADRIYDVLLETNKFPAQLGQSTRLLFANFGEAEALHCLKLLRQMRDAGIAAELYPDAVKMAKQFKYADDKGIPFVAIIGENEMKQGLVTVKDMKSGEQKAVKADDLQSVIM
ncbi:MAG: histidine--tRNA ligase [Flavobacteriales bacterium]